MSNYQLRSSGHINADSADNLHRANGRSALDKLPSLILKNKKYSEENAGQHTSTNQNVNILNLEASKPVQHSPISSRKTKNKNNRRHMMDIHDPDRGARRHSALSGYNDPAGNANDRTTEQQFEAVTNVLGPQSIADGMDDSELKHMNIKNVFVPDNTSHNFGEMQLERSIPQLHSDPKVEVFGMHRSQQKENLLLIPSVQMITNDLENSKNQLVNDYQDSSRSNNKEDQGNSVTDGDTPYKTQKKYTKCKQKSNKIIVQEDPQSMVTNLIDHFPLYMKIHRKVNGQFSRVHGLQCPSNCKQIGLIIYLIINLSIQSWIIQETVNSQIKLQTYDNSDNSSIKFNQTKMDGITFINILQIILAVVYVYVFFAMIKNGYLATTRDPTDNAVYIQRFHADNIEVKNQLKRILNYKCDLCNLIIQDNTKHCKACNRCCHKFDHHCLWLNNCIGAANYKQFIHSCLYLGLHMFASIGLAVPIIKELIEDKPDTYQSQHIFWILAINIGLNVIVILADAQLMSWHVYFYLRGITTVTHIQFTRVKNQKLQQLKNGLMTKAEYDAWYAEADSNLERFKFQSSIKTKLQNERDSYVLGKEEPNA